MATFRIRCQWVRIYNRDAADQTDSAHGNASISGVRLRSQLDEFQQIPDFANSIR